MKLPFFKKKENQPQQPAQQVYQNQSQAVNPAAPPAQSQPIAGYQTPMYRGAPPASAYTVVPPAYDTQIKKSFFSRNWLKVFFAIIFFVLFSLSVAGLYIYVIPKNSLIVENQTAGESYYVKKAQLENDGFVAFHLPNKYGKPGILIGISDLLSPDIYEDFSVPLFRGREGVPLKPPERGVKIFAILYEDSNGDQVYTNEDRPFKDMWGRKVIKTIVLE